MTAIEGQGKFTRRNSGPAAGFEAAVQRDGGDLRVTSDMCEV